MPAKIRNISATHNLSHSLLSHIMCRALLIYFLVAPYETQLAARYREGDDYFFKYLTEIIIDTNKLKDKIKNSDINFPEVILSVIK